MSPLTPSSTLDHTAREIELEADTLASPLAPRLDELLARHKARNSSGEVRALVLGTVKDIGAGGACIAFVLGVFLVGLSVHP